MNYIPRARLIERITNLLNRVSNLELIILGKDELISQLQFALQNLTIQVENAQSDQNLLNEIMDYINDNNLTDLQAFIDSLNNPPE